MTLEEWQREVEAMWVESTHTFFSMDLIVGCVDPDLGTSNGYIEDIEKAKPGNFEGNFTLD